MVSYEKCSSNPPNWLLPCVVSGAVAYILYGIANKNGSPRSNESKMNVVDSKLLPHSEDQYKGIRIGDVSDIASKDTQEFESRLRYSLQKWTADGYRGCWLKLDKSSFKHLSFCVSLGFNVHHGNPEYIMLETWLSLKKETSMIPQYAYSYVGAHSFILNRRNQMVVITEHYRPQLKIPGGAVDYGEHASDAVVREAKEETGLDCEFLGVLAVRHLLEFRFGNTCDISFICLLRPRDVNQRLEPEHKNEVNEIEWMSIDEFIENKKHIFLGTEKENLDLLRNASKWLIKFWDDIHSKDAQSQSPCINKFKQTHPFRRHADIALYHR
mmetsp:Transcript_31428/g.50905  ORF Transcript_31428/g.50905 Transcript_31428/m.50905 type:complete len:326 (-) Transcript_31428:21-998(-)